MSSIWVAETIHAEPVKGGEIEGTIDGKNVSIDVKTLRQQIPQHCFQPSTARGLGLVVHDLAIFLSILAGAIYLQNETEDHRVRTAIRYIIYPFLASLPLTGLWVLAHECGHGSFSPSTKLANTVGFIIHSSLLLPYFAWRSTHGRHHQFANNLSTDLNYVPPMREEYSELLRGKVDLEEMVEDAPAVVFIRIVLQQLVGWPWYLLTHITAAPGSSPRPSKGWWDNSHFVPWSSLFRPNEFWNMVISDVGIAAVGACLYQVGQKLGFSTVVWGYVLPYIWVNHWIVMITYLHHTSPALPKYTPESWTYLRGALATVDRDPGFVLRYMFHHIIDLHVIHHLFPRIPHYHAQEATDAIKPLLGDYYHTDTGSYWGALWTAFTQCQWVEADSTRTVAANVYGKPVEDRENDYSHDYNEKSAARVSSSSLSRIDEEGVMWYRPGKMPRPATCMRSP